jgi:hypothetical protein
MTLPSGRELSYVDCAVCGASATFGLVLLTHDASPADLGAPLIVLVLFALARLLDLADERRRP